MTRRTRLAFTVVELLVVIAIIGTLVGLLLPAVNYARNVMRKTQCATNMKQFGVAEIAYDSAKGSMSASRGFPANRSISQMNADLSDTSSASNPSAQSWVVPLLPHIERNDLYDQVESVTGTNQAMPNFDGQRIPIAWCPSDISDNNAANRSSYAVNGGRFNATRPSSGPPILPLDWQGNGCMDDRLRGGSQAGAFVIYQGPSAMTMAELVRGDGSSNTLMLLENADLRGWNRADSEQDVAVVWSPDQPDSNTGDDTYALNLYDPTQTGGPTVRRKSGGAISKKHARPSSFHANGFNVVFCDGTTKFIADSIDYRIYCQLMTSSSKLEALKNPGTSAQTFTPMTQLPLLSSGSY